MSDPFIYNWITNHKIKSSAKLIPLLPCVEAVMLLSWGSAIDNKQVDHIEGKQAISFYLTK